MLYKISRVSNFVGDKQPCEEAFKSEYTSIDERSVSSPEQIPSYKKRKDLIDKDWYGKGSNHRVENGHIKRDFEGTEGWFVELNSLEELNSLQEKYGDLIIQKHCGVVSILIYDDYIE